MNDHHYIGLDVHKKTITYVIKTHQGQLVRQGSVLATRRDLAAWRRLDSEQGSCAQSSIPV